MSKLEKTSLWLLGLETIRFFIKKHFVNKNLNKFCTCQNFFKKLVFYRSTRLFKIRKIYFFLFFNFSKIRTSSKTEIYFGVKRAETCIKTYSWSWMTWILFERPLYIWTEIQQFIYKPTYRKPKFWVYVLFRTVEVMQRLNRRSKTFKFFQNCLWNVQFISNIIPG